MVKIQLFRGRRKEGDVGQEEIIPQQTKERMVISHLDLTICANNVVNLDVLGNRVLSTHWVANPFIRGCMSVLKGTDECVDAGTRVGRGAAYMCVA